MSYIAESERREFVEYAFAKNWVLIPLAYPTKQPPAGRTGHLSWTIDDSKEFYDELLRTDRNIAIQTGERSGIVAIDIDPKNGGSLKSLEKVFGALPETLTFRTRSGGRHLIYAYPENAGDLRNPTGKLATGVDVRANGGYIVAPTSYVEDEHGAGKYSIEHDVPIAPLPDAIAARIRRAPASLITREHVTLPPEHYQWVLDKHRENIERARDAEEGTRDDVVYSRLCSSMQLTFSVPDEVLTPEKVREDFERNIPYRIKDLDGKYERALQYASKTPREYPWLITVSADIITQCLNNYEPEPRNVADIMMRTESERADWIVERANGNIKYAPEIGWLVWNGQVWHENESAVFEFVRQANRLLWLDYEVARRENPLPDEAKAFVWRMNGAFGIKNVLSMMQHHPQVRVHDIEVFDSHPELVSVANGTIDLRTGELYDHRKEDYITKLINVEYDPNAPRERWEQFLREVFPDDPENMARYVKTLFGYALTGFNSEHIFPVFNGRGRNGKSVMIDVIKHIMGPYAQGLLQDALDERSSNRDGEMAKMRGKRLAVLSETNDNATIDEAFVKRITGDSRLPGRALYRASFEFRRQFLLLMVTNHKPDFRSQGESVWERVHLVEFKKFFSEEEREYGLDERLMHQEARGILAWLVEGAVEWTRNGLFVPERVKLATADYKVSTDKLAEWLADRTVDGSDYKVVASELWSDYNAYMKERELRPEYRSNKAFFNTLEEKRYEKVRGAKNKVYFLGLRLKTEEELRQERFASRDTKSDELF